MAEEKKVKYTQEMKFDYVFLLHARYNKSYLRLSKTMGIPREMIRNWDDELREDVFQFIDAMSGRNASDTDGPPMDIAELKDLALQRLESTMKKEIDPSKIARALSVLNDMEKDQKEEERQIETAKESEEDIDSAIDKALNNIK